jgi:hypothetical protein
VAAAGALCLGASAAERVVDFHSAIRIQADGVLEVTERIAVEAQGREIRRGILRDFPTDYRDRFGNRMSVPFEVRRVRRNGADEPWSIERLSNGVRVRIGRADALLPRGTHVYEISYRTARQIGHFAGHDELYWNVNGNGWPFSFDHISAEVQLPKAVPAADLRAEAYTGPMGARGRNYQYMVRDGGVGFTSTARFAPREGMTIVVSFPKGIVGEPGIVRRAGWFLAQNLGATAGGAGFLCMLGFLYWRWRAVGRDPRAAPKFPRYEAPKGLSPAAVRFIDRQGFDDRCFAAALLGLGSRGFLKIRHAHDRFVLEPTGKAAAELLPEERAVAPLAAKTRTLYKTYDQVVRSVRSNLEDELKRLYEGKAFSRNYDSLALGALIGAGAIALMALMDTALAVVVAIAALIVAALVAFYRWLPAYSVAGRRTQDEIDGLRQYLGVAERDELARKKAPPKTAEEFSRFLPYAVALDVEKTWADRFALALGSAAMAQAVAGWYQSSDGGFSVSSLTSSVSSLGETVSAAATPPGSSSGSSSSGGGGGGGGSSGGGGGGGGGSGW